MFDINSPAAMGARNQILKGLGCNPLCQAVVVVRVIYNDPVTVIYWSDHTRTVVKCQPGDTYDPKIGFLMALCKKACGNTGRYNELLKECIPGYGKEDTEDGRVESSSDQ